ncbi:MAG TPA: serine/threonine-protein kinase, partial [Gemmatimonadaceae bacterium]|nr:serine/threonine-protein kinase [Gemmatimonadaceae bacterium]
TPLRPAAAAPPPPPPPGGMHTVDFSKLAGQLLDNRYQVAKKVGEGGMSFVYLAQDTNTGEKVAIKILSPALIKDQNAMARLRREAALGGRLAHPNVCHIIRLGETNMGLVYIVMPFVQGELLCDRTNRQGRIPLEETAGFVRDMTAGLHVAHELGIIHRDLKPENIMVVARPDGTHRAVVMDFGLAKERQMSAEVQKLTATGIVLGTPEFMSPEQLRGKTLDARTDIYSLAVMVYEMLTAKLPFPGRTQQEIMIARLKGDPIPIRQMRPELDIPVAVERVLAKALSRDPDQRYASTLEFGEAFTRAASGQGDAGGDGGSGGGVLGKIFGR